MFMCGAVEAARNQEQTTETGVSFSGSKSKTGCSPFLAGAPVALRGAKRVEPPLQVRAWQTLPEMTPSQIRTRINLHDLKARIIKRVGPDRANQYFNHFRSFISAKLRKDELEKLVILTIGKESIALHNQLIRAVLSNAIHGEVPPPHPPAQDTSKPVKGIRRKPPTPSISNDDSFPQNPGSPAPSVWSNGDFFTLSSRKGNSGIRDCRTNKERPSPVGTQGRGEVLCSQGILVHEAGANSGANGDFRSPDLARPLQDIQGAAEQSDGELGSPLMPPGKRLRIFSRNEAPILESKEKAILRTVELNEGDVDDDDDSFLLRANGSIRAPLGIPFCPGSVGSARKSSFVGVPPHLAHFLLVNGKEEEFVDLGDLPDAETMQKRMNQIAVVEGLQGVSTECAILLNQALDIVLKRLITACVNLVGSRSSQEQDQPISKDRELLWDKEAKKELCLPGVKLHQGLNGVCPGLSLQAIDTEGTSGVGEKERERSHPPVSLLDFKVAMELNPQQLGEDWPLQLEKISCRLFEH